MSPPLAADAELGPLQLEVRGDEVVDHGVVVVLDPGRARVHLQPVVVAQHLLQTCEQLLTIS